jgi:hypothetical protein
MILCVVLYAMNMDSDDEIPADEISAKNNSAIAAMASLLSSEMQGAWRIGRVSIIIDYR